MKLSTFVDLFTVALYNEMSVSGRSNFSFGDIVDRYGLTFLPIWRESIFEDYDFDMRIKTRRHLGPMRAQQVSLQSYGLRWVEDEVGENVTSFLEQHGAVYQPSDDPIVEIQRAINSADWTGIAQRIQPDQLASIKRQVRSILATIDQSEADEKTKENFKIYVNAAISALEAPDPPWKAIVELLNHPGLTAILTVMNVLQIIFGIST
jgi:hypothetical protein